MTLSEFPQHSQVFVGQASRPAPDVYVRPTAERRRIAFGPGCARSWSGHAAVPRADAGLETRHRHKPPDLHYGQDTSVVFKYEEQEK
jgi:hypothetical protein